VHVLQMLYQDSSFFSLATRIETEMQTEGRKVTNPERWLKWQQPRDRLLPELRRPCHHSRRNMPRRLDLPRSLPTDPCRLRPPSHSLKQNRSLRVSICFSSFFLVNSQVNSSHKSLCLYLCLCRSPSSHLAFSTQAPYCFKPPFSANKEWLPTLLQMVPHSNSKRPGYEQLKTSIYYNIGSSAKQTEEVGHDEYNNSICSAPPAAPAAVSPSFYAVFGGRLCDQTRPSSKTNDIYSQI
jgi:hypothetical protein